MLPLNLKDSNPNYIQPIFNDELNPVISNAEANLISELVFAVIKEPVKGRFFKRFMIAEIEKNFLNPMWTVRSESTDNEHIIYELDVNGIGTGLCLQIFRKLELYNVFLMNF